MTAAAPLLVKARRVLFVSVAKRDRGLAAEIATTAREIAGIEAEVQVFPPAEAASPTRSRPRQKSAGASLLVAGAYGRSRGREILFGSCTDKLLERCDRPILLMHS